MVHFTAIPDRVVYQAKLDALRTEIEERGDDTCADTLEKALIYFKQWYSQDIEGVGENVEFENWCDTWGWCDDYEALYGEPLTEPRQTYPVKAKGKMTENYNKTALKETLNELISLIS